MINSNWLEQLYNVDAIVLGSIVGSVVLAFILVVLISSLKIKSQHDHLKSLRQELSDAKKQIEAEQKTHAQMQQIIQDIDRALEHYQQVEDEQGKIIVNLRAKLNKSSQTVKQLTEQIDKNKREKTIIIEGAEKIHQKLLVAQDEIDEVRKRNEFWIDQISELRIKHDALRNKLSRIERSRA